jgi:hypothetical protein
VFVAMIGFFFANPDQVRLWTVYRMLEVARELDELCAAATSTSLRRVGARRVRVAARTVAKLNRVGFPKPFPMGRPPRAFRRQARADVRGLRAAISSRAVELARATPKGWSDFKMTCAGRRSACTRVAYGSTRTWPGPCGRHTSAVSDN